MPKIDLERGVVIRTAPNIITPPKTDGRRRLGDWLRTFLDYTEQAESPSEYLQWVGLSTIAGAAQRKVYMESTLFYVHSNMYVTLVGPPGSKKSTAIRQGRKLLGQVPGVNLTSDAPSVAGLIEEFREIPTKEHQSLNAFIYELSSLFENAAETMTGFLTAIYDGDPDYSKRTRAHGKERVPFPWLNMVAGTTPTWLGDNLSKSAIEGGYVARHIYVYSEEVILKTPFPYYDQKYKELEVELVHDLAHISQLAGQFTFSKSGAHWYNDWYLNKSRFPDISDNRTAGYYVRKPIHLLKVAMALTLASSDVLELTEEKLQLALAFLDSIEPGMKKAFSAVGGNTYATDLERMLAQIQQSGKGLPYSDVLRANLHAMDKRNIDATLDALVAMGAVNKTLKGGGMFYEPR